MGIIIIISSFINNVISLPFLFSYENRTSMTALIYFVIVSLTTLVCQFLLLLSISKKQTLHIHFKRKYHYLKLLIFSSVSFMIFLFFILVFDLYINHNYDLFLYEFIIVYNLILAIGIIAILAIKFGSWLKKKQNITVLLYTLAFSTFVLVIISVLFLIVQELNGRPSDVSPQPNPWDKTSTRVLFFNDVYRISLLISFIFIWVASSILLTSYSKNYIRKIGKAKFWFVVSLPLLYYLFSLDIVTNTFNSLIFQYSYLSTIFIYIFGATKHIGGFFFALPFIYMAKNIENLHIKYYLILSAVGIMTLFSSIQISILQILPYPPFGLTTITVMPVASFLLIIGLFYCAQSLSYDRQLLSELGRYIKNKPNLFLQNIGSIEWSNNMEGIVKQIKKEQVIESMVDEPAPSALTKTDIQDYIYKVLEEVKGKKNEK